MKLTLKLDDAGHVVVRGGSPVYVDQAGKDVTFDAPTLMQRADRAERLLTVREAFANSQLMASDRLALPAPMVRAAFEDNFRIEDGKLVPIDQNGNPVYSQRRIGEVADFDEGLELLIARHPNKDAILRGPSTPAGASATATGKPGAVMKRGHFVTMRPAEQMAHIKAGGTIVD